MSHFYPLESQSEKAQVLECRSVERFTVRKSREIHAADVMNGRGKGSAEGSSDPSEQPQESSKKLQAHPTIGTKAFVAEVKCLNGCRTGRVGGHVHLAVLIWMKMML
jgi:hypothetical protein